MGDKGGEETDVGEVAACGAGGELTATGERNGGGVGGDPGRS